MKPMMFPLLLAGLLAAPALAADKAGIPDAHMMAEHQQWQADHDGWHAAHLLLAKRLEALAAKLRTPDPSFSEHGAELRAHAANMAKPTDMTALAASHARLASEHEEARIAHHELLDQVRNLESLIEDDRATEAKEALPPR